MENLQIFALAKSFTKLCNLLTARYIGRELNGVAGNRPALNRKVNTMGASMNAAQIAAAKATTAKATTATTAKATTAKATTAKATTAKATTAKATTAKATTAKTTTAKATTAARYASGLGLTATTKLTWIAKTNPKREGTQAHALWQAAAYAPTYGDLVAKVGKGPAKLLVSWGAAHGQVTPA